MNNIFDHQLIKRNKDGKKDDKLGRICEILVETHLLLLGFLVEHPGRDDPYDISFRHPGDFSISYTIQVKNISDNDRISTTSRPSGTNNSNKINYAVVGGGIDYLAGVDLYKQTILYWDRAFFSQFNDSFSVKKHSVSAVNIEPVIETPWELRNKEGYYNNKSPYATLDNISRNHDES